MPILLSWRGIKGSTYGIVCATQAIPSRQWRLALGSVIRAGSAWVEQALVPALQPVNIVVMGNLGSHKVTGIAAAIEAAGARVRYLPPYSPDYHPIKQVFAKFKALRRKTVARTMDAL